MLFQQGGPQAVRNQSRHPLFQKAVAKNRLQGLVSDLSIQFMLAAGHGQNRPGIPLHRSGQRIVRGSIAGVERYHQVYLVHSLIIRDIPCQKLQLFIAEPLRQLIAAANNILLQIQADNPQVKSLQFPKIIVHGKRQVGFSAAEINHGQFPSSGKRRTDIPDKFQEPVDLPEFIIPAVYHLSLRGHHSQLHQERHRRSFFQNIVLFPVVGQLRRARNPGPLFLLHSYLSFFAYQHRGGHLCRLRLHLPVIRFHPAGRRLYEVLFFIIDMGFLLSIPESRLISEVSLHRQRPHSDLYRRLRPLCSAEYHPQQVPV